MTPQVLKQLAEEWIPFNKFIGLKALSIEKGEIFFEIRHAVEQVDEEPVQADDQREREGMLAGHQPTERG